MARYPGQRIAVMAAFAPKKPPPANQHSEKEERKVDSDELDQGKYYYYMIGIRGDYNLGTNLDDLGNSNPIYRSPFFPQDDFVRDITFGLVLGGGLELEVSELFGAMLELSISPDFTKQYEQLPIRNVINPYNPGQTITLQQTDIRNISVEISVGFRLLRKVEYID